MEIGIVLENSWLERQNIESKFIWGHWKMSQSFSDVRSLDFQTLTLFTSAFISSWILYNSGVRSSTYHPKHNKKEAVQKKIMTQTSCHDSYVLASPAVTAMC